MHKPEPNPFIYSAYATSIGAALYKPSTAFLTDGPSAALPTTGGLICSVQEDVRFAIGSSEIIRVRRASAKVSGQKSDHHYISQATATVEKLNILNVLTADRVVAKVTSVYSTGNESSRFFLSGSHFDNLKIDGKFYDCQLEREETQDGFMLEKACHSCSHIFKSNYQRIQVEQFGAIHLGEIFQYGGKVILNMFRAELGCPDQGSASGPQASTNGGKGLG